MLGGRGVECISVTWHAYRGLLSAYLAGIPLLGSLGVPLHPSSLCRKPHILFEQGGGFGGCHGGCGLCVLCHCWLSPVEYNLKVNKILLIN
jgi:hypothetical protein